MGECSFDSLLKTKLGGNLRVTVKNYISFGIYKRKFENGVTKNYPSIFNLLKQIVTDGGVQRIIIFQQNKYTKLKK